MSINRKPRALVCALAAIGVVAGASAASGQAIDVTGTQRVGAETKSVQVAFGDLDLVAGPGRARLDRRIRWAAGYVCGSVPRKGLDARNDQAACKTAAVDDANAQLRTLVPAMIAGGGGMN